jgi:galactose mutarotase-like enzyme
MNYIIENDKLRVTAAILGGELKSLYGKEENQEYLWPGKKPYWEDSAPNLFPYIARMTNGTYLYQGKLYHMPIHGFVKDMELSAKASAQELTFELVANEKTRAYYPFEFVYRIRYSLQDTKLTIAYEVENTDKATMFFGIGGHPGFHLPFEKDTTFEDYFIEFEETAAPIRILFSKDCFVDGEKPYEGLLESRLHLKHALFDQDAIVLKNAGKKVVLQSKKACADKKAVTVSFPQMDYVGVWQNDHTKAPFVCIEPWSSLPSREGVVEDLEKQENLIRLSPGEHYHNCWSISIDPLT